MADYRGPLSRFKVLDLTRVRAGPTAVRQLADWGADVIKIEAPAAVDKSKDIGGQRDGPDFQNIHRNKRSITLNLKETTGRDLFMKLVETADVVATLGQSKREDQWVVGFALETEDRRFRAIAKLERKHCDLMVSNGPRAIDAADNEVELIDPDGKVNVPLVTHPRNDEHPSWSPDGRMIAFSSTRRGSADIYVIDTTGGNLRRLTQGPGEDVNPKRL